MENIMNDGNAQRLDNIKFSGDGWEFEWGYTKSEVLDTDTFLKQLVELFKEKKIVSIGEVHDNNNDTSFDWIINYGGEISVAYDFYQHAQQQQQPKISLERLLPNESTLIHAIRSISLNPEDYRDKHAGRLFAMLVLPIAKLSGFTDVVFEGDPDPRAILSEHGDMLNRDKIGAALRVTMAMYWGLNIHGASFTRSQTANVVGDLIFDKIREIRKHNPDAKVLVYNGAMHNMTIPITGTMAEYGAGYDASGITYAPRALKSWGPDYGAIDIINHTPPIEDEIHFQFMQEHADPYGVTCFSHGINQKTYII
jgi:hypothetical protein